MLLLLFVHMNMNVRVGCYSIRSYGQNSYIFQNVYKYGMLRFHFNDFNVLFEASIVVCFKACLLFFFQLLIAKANAQIFRTSFIVRNSIRGSNT